MIFALPGIAFGKIEGKIECRAARQNPRLEPHTVHPEPLRRGRRVGHIVPAIEPVMEAEGSGVFDQQGAAGRQFGKWLRRSPMPGHRYWAPRLVPPLHAGEQLRRTPK